MIFKVFFKAFNKLFLLSYYSFGYFYNPLSWSWTDSWILLLMMYIHVVWVLKWINIAAESHWGKDESTEGIKWKAHVRHEKNQRAETFRWTLIKRQLFFKLWLDSKERIKQKIFFLPRIPLSVTIHICQYIKIIINTCSCCAFTYNNTFLLH